MILESIALGQVLAPVVSALVFVVLYHYIGSEYLGAAENKYWNALRVVLLSTGDSYVRENSTFALTNTAHERELVGTVDMSSDELAYELEGKGYAQCVLSGLKKRGEEYENGSMAYRESRSDLLPDALALYQTHVFWFENDDGTIDVYAHHEYSSLNPLVSWKHYRAVGQDAAKGVALVKETFDFL